MSDETVALDAHVTGRVQGVSYRAWTRAEALALGLTGWVYNRPDGAVQVRLQGPADAVAGMARRLREGPAAAQVADVMTEPAAPEPGQTGFEIRA